MCTLNIRQGAQLTWQYFSMCRYRNEATGAERDEKLREKQDCVAHPQCFMFWGLSIRMASLILRSWSGHALVTVIL